MNYTKRETYRISHYRVKGKLTEQLESVTCYDFDAPGGVLVSVASGWDKRHWMLFDPYTGLLLTNQTFESRKRATSYICEHGPALTRLATMREDESSPNYDKYQRLVEHYNYLVNNKMRGIS